MAAYSPATTKLMAISKQRVYRGSEACIGVKTTPSKIAANPKMAAVHAHRHIGEAGRVHGHIWIERNPDELGAYIVAFADGCSFCYSPWELTIEG